MHASVSMSATGREHILALHLWPVNLRSVTSAPALAAAEPRPHHTGSSSAFLVLTGTHHMLDLLWLHFQSELAESALHLCVFTSARA